MDFSILPIEKIEDLTEDVFTSAVRDVMNRDKHEPHYLLVYKNGNSFVSIRNTTNLDDSDIPSMHISVYDRNNENLFFGIIRKNTTNDIAKVMYGIVQTYADMIR